MNKKPVIVLINSEEELRMIAALKEKVSSK